MKIFLATADLTEIRWAVDHGLTDGVLTTPRLLSAADPTGDGRDVLTEICRAVALPVWAAVGAVNAADIYRDGRELARISDQIVVQIPFVEDATSAMRRLAIEGARVAATLVFNATQALLASKAGASAVSAQVDQLDAQGQDSVGVIREVRALFDRHAVECDVLAFQPRNAAHFAACALAGADSIAVAADTLRSLLLHPLTDRGLDQFLSELSKRPKPRP